MNKSNFHSNSPLQNDSGTITLISLGLISLICISVFCFLQIFNLLDTDKATHHICQQQLLRLQKNIAADLQKLLNLNDSARSIQKSKAIGKGMIVAGATTADPILVAAGERILAASHKSEKALIGMQNYLMITANRKMHEGPISISEQIKRELSARRIRLEKTGKDDFSARLQTIQVVPRTARLAVRKIPSDDGPPEYELQDQFMQKQALHISWKYRHETGVGGTLLWKKISTSNQGKCSVSLESLEKSFQSVLIGDRF